MAEGYQSGYGKRPLWQWVAIYAVVGLLIYGLIYYFVIAKPRVAPVAEPAAGSPSATISQDTVTLTADGFFPATLTIKAGTKVTWTNQSGSGATVSSNPHPIHTDYQPLNLGNFENGSSLSLTFDKPGTYGYHNHLNPSQSATVIVQ